MAFSQEVTAQLSQPLDPSRVKTRSNRGGSLSYLEGYDVIDTLNTIFGFDGWQLDVKDVRQFGPVIQATVSVAVFDPAHGYVTRTDVGAAIPAGDSNEALETAIKAAVTDGMKRAARTFGNQFGNSLYAKDSPLHATTGNTGTRHTAGRTNGAAAGNATNGTANSGGTAGRSAATNGGGRKVSDAQVGLIKRLGGTDDEANNRFGVANIADLSMSDASAWISEMKGGDDRPAPARRSAPAKQTDPLDDVPF